MSGLLVALPIISGPVLAFVALEHGPIVAALTAAGILAGRMSTVTYCLVYARLANHMSWLPAVGMSTLIFAVCTWLLQRVVLPLPALFAAVVMVVLIVLRLLPHKAHTRSPAPTPWCEIPARMSIATASVVALTAFVPILGPQLTGLLVPFPILTTILAAFAYAFQGLEAAVQVVRGVVTGNFGFAVFLVVIAALLPPAGPIATLVVAIGATLTFQAISLKFLISTPTREEAREVSLSPDKLGSQSGKEV